MPVAIRIHVLELPMRRPFRSSAELVGARTTALVELMDGRFGWGEAAPFPGQDEAMRELLDSASLGRATPTLAAAIDEAAASAEGAVPSGRGVPRGCLAVGLDGAVDVVDRAVEQGVQAFKLKVAPGAVDHVVQIRDRYPTLTLGIDGNASFHGGVSDLGVWRDLDLAFAEELFTDWEEAAASGFSEFGVPHFADESVRSLSDAERLLTHPGVDGVTIKPGRLGWSGARRVLELAQDHQKVWRASGLLETSVGRAYTNVLSLTSGAFVSDVAPADWFLDDVIDAIDGVPVSPVEPDRARIERYRVEMLDAVIDA